MPRLHIRTDKELDHAIKAYARANRLTTSQAARELLRQAATSAKPVTRGWLEGYSAGYGEAREAFETKARRPVPPT